MMNSKNSIIVDPFPQLICANKLFVLNTLI